MMPRSRKILCSGMLLVCAALGAMRALPEAAHAQEAVQPAAPEESAASSAEDAYTFEKIPNNDVIGDFVLGPGKVELTIEPGQSKTVELAVTNRTGEERAFRFEVEDAAGSADGSQAVVLLGDDRGPYTLKDYVTVPDESVEVAHGERVRVPVTISIPEDAEPGGRYGSVLVSTVTRPEMRAEAGAAPQSALVARIGTLFFITVPGDIERAGQLEDFATVPPQGWFSSGPIRFSILFRNTGSTHLNPYGEIRIRNMFGEEVGFVQLEPWFAMPKSLRFREASFDREHLFGRYEATVSVNRGYDDVIDTKTIHFWVIPWKLALVIFVGLFVLLYVLRLLFKNFEFRRKA